MKKNILYINLFLIFFVTSSVPASILERIDKVESFSAIQLFFTLDTMAKYSIDQTGRRIDINLENSSPAESLEFPPEDPTIIRYTTGKSKDLLTISLFLRYLPENFSLTRVDVNTLVFELIPGSIYTKSVKNLERQLDDSINQQQEQFPPKTPLTDSEYRNNWKSFYRRFEPNSAINIQVNFTWPPFPVMQFAPPNYEKNIELLPPELLTAAQNGSWGELNLAIPKLINEAIEDPEKQKMLALTYGEVLGRQGDFVGSYKQLYLLKEKYQNEILAPISEYLMLLIQAEHTDPYLANFELKTIQEQFPPNNKLLPYVLISRIETALATSNLKQLNKLLLNEDLAFPKFTEAIKSMRQADYWFSLQQPIKAAAAYRLLNNEKLLKQYPFSLNGYCSSLFHQKKYVEAAACYQDLEKIVLDSDALSLVRYRKLVSQSKALKEDLQNRFEQLAMSAPNSEGGIRGRLKTHDIDMMRTNTPETYSHIGDSYIKAARSCLDRFISEEAYFKGALAYYLAQETDRSVKILMKLLREFQSGTLRQTTQALLLQVLPLEIERLAQKGQNRELVILAQQNANLFSNNWIDNVSVSHLAEAYLNLKLYKEAHRLFLHLASTSPEPIRQNSFLPLIKSAYEAGMYDRVDTYATRYKFNFPEDAANDQILFYQTMALFNMNKYERALNILPSPFPVSPHIRRLAIDIYFYNEKYQETLGLIKKYLSENQGTTTEITFIKAECLYQTNKKDEAYKLFQTVSKKSLHWSQAMYRQADFLRSQNRNDEAIQILKELIKNSKNSNWVKLAQQEIKFIQNSTIN